MPFVVYPLCWRAASILPHYFVYSPRLYLRDAGEFEGAVINELKRRKKEYL